LIVNTFFFASAVRFALGQVENRTNIAISFDTAEGNLWAGKVRLNGVTVTRREHPASLFDLKGESVDVHISLAALLRWSVVFESVHISKFSGTWEQNGKAGPLKPRRNFQINRLLLDDIQLDFTDRTLETGPLHAVLCLDTLEAVPLRSQWAMFDVLFRSRIRGSVNDVPFVVDSEKGRHFCRFDEVPIEIFAHYVGIFQWFDKGKVDLLIEDTFDGGEITLRWSLVFHDFHARIPEGSPFKAKAAALPLITFLNIKSKRLPLELEFQLQENEFRFRSSTELSDMARIILGDKIMDTFQRLKDKPPAE
jgi:hypothetical protein